MDEREALLRAAQLADSVQRTSPNPKVGCVILHPDGRPLGEGFHRGAGHPHAEVEALRAAGPAAAGATAVVTLEPCDHIGRTGPCTEALLRAGIARVVIGRPDPNPVAAGGSVTLRAAGVEVVFAEPEQALGQLNRFWETAVRNGRPCVVWKTAATLDGRVAAPDGSSRWITGSEARAQVHALRSELDAVLIGTGTALADDPHLTVRPGHGVIQPLRVVVGDRELPDTARVLDDAAPTMRLPRDAPEQTLARLWDAGVRSILLEAGPRLASAFLRADLVDCAVWFVAPRLLGSGRSVTDDLGAATLADGTLWQLDSVRQVGADVRLDLSRKD